MYVMCVICHEPLKMMPPRTTENLKDRICTISCGHIFHVSCINEWWKELLRKTHPEERHNVVYTCVLCRRELRDPLVFELFPSAMEEPKAVPDATMDAEGDDARLVPNLKIASLKALVENYEKEIQKLKCQLQAMAKSEKMDKCDEAPQLE